MKPETISQMIEVLQSNPDILGLVEYGSTRASGARIEGDYDLIVILNKGCPGVESLHFYVGQTPVDLNLRGIDDIEEMERADSFNSVLLSGRIIHDPSAQVACALEGLRARHERSGVRPVASPRIAGMRHGARHTFDKLDRAGEPDLTLNYYLLHQCVYWLVPQYFEVRGIQYRGEKRALAYLRQNEPEIATNLDKFYATTDSLSQKQLARLIAEAVLAPVGGLWKQAELLVFGDRQKGQDLFEHLLGGVDE